MMTGQTYWLPRTGAQFNVLETDGTRGIAAGFRTGGRMLFVHTPDGCYARQVTDNGQPGTLLDTLVPFGPRYAARPARTC